MRKILCILTVSLVAVIMTACAGGSASSRSGNGSTDVNSVIESKIAEEKGDAAASASRQSGADVGAPLPEGTDYVDELLSSTEGIDIDLTALSSTMVYSEVYNMMIAPQEYIGKTIRMNGAFSLYHDEAADINYYACVIADAAACCSSGIEFELTDSYSYPGDYPEPGDDITVTGVFDTYSEGQATYCTLRNAELG